MYFCSEFFICISGILFCVIKEIFCEIEKEKKCNVICTPFEIIDLVIWKIENGRIIQCISENASGEQKKIFEEYLIECRRKEIE